MTRKRNNVLTFAQFLLLTVLVLFVLTSSAILSMKLQVRMAELKQQSKILNTVWAAKKYDVLINSYMNSGSTFTGRALGFHRDSFYFYEPLWHISEWSYYRTNTTMCSTRIYSCRTISRSDMNRNRPSLGQRLDFQLLHDINITSKTSPRQISQIILDHIYKCRLEKLQNIIQPGVTAEAKFSGPSWNEYRYCLQRRNSMETCLQVISDICRKATHRVSKVLRITLEALEPLLQNNPRLKVVHLFRDPRAIVNSRIETQGYPLRSSESSMPSIKSNAKALCDKMAADLKEGTILYRKFPDRFRFIHYEDIIGNKKALLTLYSFVGMPTTEANIINVKSIKTNPSKRQHETRERSRKTNNAYWWTKYMTWKSVEVVNSECLHVIKELGYPVIQYIDDFQHFNMNKSIAKLKFTFK